MQGLNVKQFNRNGWNLGIRWFYIISRLLVEVYPLSSEMQSVYSTTPTDWVVFGICYLFYPCVCRPTGNIAYLKQAAPSTFWHILIIQRLDFSLILIFALTHYFWFILQVIIYFYSVSLFILVCYICHERVLNIVNRTYVYIISNKEGKESKTRGDCQFINYVVIRPRGSHIAPAYIMPKNTSLALKRKQS